MNNKIRCNIILWGCMAAIITLFISQGAVAADDNGQFGIRGAGLISCAMYEQERKAQDQVYLLTAAWVDGYITGTNQHAADTYDIMPFETTELIAAVLGEHCKENPDSSVFAVLSSLLKTVYDDRLIVRSDKTDVVIGQRTASMYVEVLKKVQNKLASKGFYSGKINGHYDPPTIDAMKAYQQSIDFNPTGFPDQLTLWKLLRAGA